MESSVSFSSSPSSWRAGSRSWEEFLQVAPPSPPRGHVAPLSATGGGHLAPLSPLAAPSPGGDQRSLEESPHLHLHSSTCAFTPPPTPSPNLSTGSVQMQNEVSFSFGKKIHGSNWSSQELLKVVPGEFREEPAKRPGPGSSEVERPPPGLSDAKRPSGSSEEEWVRKSSGPGKVRFVPISVPGGRILHTLVCILVSQPYLP